MRELELELDVESLEQRAMLAGNVTATVVGSNLVIKGDASGNALKISSTAESGTLIIHGVDNTTIDGQVTQIVEGIDGGIRIHLRNGDNSVLLKREAFTTFHLDRGVSIRAGNGHDVAGLFGVDVGGATSIRLGDGDNLADFSNGQSRGLKVKTGAGADLAYLHNSDHLRGFNVNAGDGNDIIKSSFNEFFVAANTIKAGKGNDLVDVSNSFFNTSRAPLIDGQAGDDGFNGRFEFATGNRNVRFEHELSAGQITGPIESHRGRAIYNELFSYGGGDSATSLESVADAELPAIIINAWGQTGQEQFSLLIDGQVVASYNAATTWTPFEYTSSDQITADQVRIEFTNDLYDPANGIDRNLFVDSVQIYGQAHRSDSSETFSTGTWTDSDGIQPGYGRGIVLNADGYFQYSGSTAQFTNLIVRARGDGGGEQFRVMSNGDTVGTFTVSTEFQDYSLSLFTGIAGYTAESLRIDFINDLYQPDQGIDRNLTVDYVSIDGTVYETEATTTFASGVWVPGQGIQSGYLQSETLNAEGFFDYRTVLNYQPDLEEIAALFPDRTLHSNGPLNVAAAGDGGWIVSTWEAENSFDIEPLPTPLIFKVNGFGNLDQSFANSGVIDNPGVEIRTTFSGPTLGPGFPLFDAAHVEVDSSGRILLAGSHVGNSNRAVVRFQANGQRDTSFGSGGVATLTLGDDSRFDEQRQLTIQADGSILSVASFFLPFDLNAGVRPMGTSVWKLTDTGAFDVGYGNYSGVAIHGTRGSQYLVDTQGRVLIGTDLQVARIDSSGSLDASFGAGGVFQTDQAFDVGFDRLGSYGGPCTPLAPYVGCDNSLTSLEVAEDGRIILTVRQQDTFGRSSSVDYGTMYLVLTNFGQLDTNFSGDGADSTRPLL